MEALSHHNELIRRETLIDRVHDAERNFKLFEQWNPAKGKYHPPQMERLVKIDNQPSAIKPDLIAAYSFELCELIKPESELQDRADLLMNRSSSILNFELAQITKQGFEVLADDMLIEHMVKKHIFLAREYVDSLTFTQLSVELPSLITSKKVPALQAISTMESKNMIGILNRRVAEGIVRTMVGWHQGLDLPKPIEIESAKT